MSSWYEVPCRICGGSIHVHADWSNPPSVCKECKAEQAAKWYDVACQCCGTAIRAHQDWDRPPSFCKACKAKYAAYAATCDHCGGTFTISTGTQINAYLKGWDLPKRCPGCRELFKHKPFRTIRESDGSSKTYNSRGDLLFVSQTEQGFFGNEYRVHSGKGGRITGVTTEKSDFFGNTYRESKGADGKVKSRSREETDLFGNTYSSSVGGSSDTKHETRTKTDWTGRKYRETK